MSDFNLLPFDLYQSELWRYLPIEDILKYCQTNREFQQICNDSNTWRYLLYRDYSVSGSDNPREEYMYHYRISQYNNWLASIRQELTNKNQRDLLNFARVRAFRGFSIMNPQQLIDNIMNSVARLYTKDNFNYLNTLDNLTITG